MSYAQIAMFGAAGCYVIASVAYVIEGKPWTAATTMSFAIGALTLWMGGRG